MDRVIHTLVLSFPVLLLTVKPLAIIIFVALGFIGIYLSIKNKENPFKIESIKIFSWLTVNYFLVMAFSVLISTEPTNSWTHLGRVVHFLYAPYVALAVIKVDISLSSLAKSFKIGTVIAAIISTIGFILADGIGRFSGMYNPNTFGDLAVMMLFFSLTDIENESKKEYYLTLLVVFLGVTAISMSGSRGSILSSLFLLIVYISLMYKAMPDRHKRIWIVVLVFILSMAINLSANPSTRLFSIKSEVHKWEADKDTSSSSGARLQMYVAGLKAFVDSPIVGYGYHNCGSVAARYTSQDRVTQNNFKDRWHLHDQFLTTAVNSGMLGLISLVLLYFIPLFIFLKKIKHNPLAAMGVVLILGYIALGATHTLFGYAYETVFFILLLAWIISSVVKSKNEID